MQPLSLIWFILHPETSKTVCREIGISDILYARIMDALISYAFNNVCTHFVRSLNHTFIPKKRVNTFLPVFAIGNNVEISSIQISFKDKLAWSAGTI
jgi:hypothetical protein